jgi:hypothetical protein
MMADYEETIKQGRAIVRLIEATNVLLPDAGQREAELLRDLRIRYQKRLRKLVAKLPVKISAQILAASEHINGPIGDTTLN